MGEAKERERAFHAELRDIFVGRLAEGEGGVFLAGFQGFWGRGDFWRGSPEEDTFVGDIFGEDSGGSGEFWREREVSAVRGILFWRV